MTDDELIQALRHRLPSEIRASDLVGIVHDFAADDFERCATWIESLASPTLANDPFIRAADWAARLVREYASRVAA